MKKETSANISYLDTLTITRVDNLWLGEGTAELTFSARCRLFLLRLLLGAHNAVVYVFSVKERILEERTVLESLKQEGLIDSYGEGPVYADYPRFNFFGISFRMTKDRPPLRSWGYTLPTDDKTKAIKNALWETCERHASYHGEGVKNVEYPNFKQGDASFLYDRIAHVTAEQQARDDTVVGRESDMKALTGFIAPSLTADRARFLPADCFYWGERVGEKEKHFHDVTTNGSGGGATKEAAILSGLYELIERDAFLLFWLTGIAPPQIDIGVEQGDLFDHIRDARTRFKLEVYFFNIRYDIATPVCLCLIIDPVLNLVALGGKASATGVVSIQGAYLETLATLSLLRNRGKRVAESELIKILAENKFGNPAVDKSVRVNLYHSPLGIETVKKILLGNREQHCAWADFNQLTRTFDDPENELAVLLARLKELVVEKGPAYHAYAHQFSSVLTKKFASSAAHVYIPAFLKLHLLERYVTPLSSRLTDFAREHGLRVESEADLNPLPHPFP